MCGGSQSERDRAGQQVRGDRGRAGGRRVGRRSRPYTFSDVRKANHTISGQFHAAGSVRRSTGRCREPAAPISARRRDAKRWRRGGSAELRDHAERQLVGPLHGPAGGWRFGGCGRRTTRSATCRRTIMRSRRASCGTSYTIAATAGSRRLDHPERQRSGGVRSRSGVPDRG